MSTSWPQPSLNEKQSDALSEAELRECMRRADKFPDRKGSFRRTALKRLINTAQSPDPALKKVVTEKVKDFFVDFPDLQDEAINAIYDLCEDQDQSVRILGYGAITSVSRVAKDWLLRNADVLVQLLQSDDEREVAVVKRALQEHVDLDPPNALRMLCDQCSFDAEKLEDEDERTLRLRLRKLVIDFLSEKYRGCIARVVKDIEVEKVLVRGLVPVIPRATLSERRKLIYDILINLPSFTSLTSTEVFDTVLDISHSALDFDLTSTQETASDLKNALPLLQFVSILTSDQVSDASGSVPPVPRGNTPSRRQINPKNVARLLKFYLSLLSPVGLLYGNILEKSVTPMSCVIFIFFRTQSYESVERCKLMTETTNDPVDHFIHLINILTSVLSSPDATPHLMCLTIRPLLTLLRAVQKCLLGSEAKQIPPGLRSDLRLLLTKLSSVEPSPSRLKESEYVNELLPLPTAQEVIKMREEISGTIRNFDETFAETPTTTERDEIRIKGRGSAIRPGPTKRRLDIGDNSPTSPAMMGVDQDTSIRGAAKLAHDAMDVDIIQSSSAVLSSSESPYENQSSRARKRRRGRGGGADETSSVAANSTSAISPQQRIESPSLLSRLQEFPPSTASTRVSTSKQHTSGPTSTSLAARLAPFKSSNFSAPTTGDVSSNDLAARLDKPSIVRSNWSMLSSGSSQPPKSTTTSHDHSSKRHSERGNPTIPGERFRQRFVRGLSIHGAAALATDNSDSLDNGNGEIKIRGAAQRVIDDNPDGSERGQPISLLRRLGDGSGGNSGKGGVGVGVHHIRK